jgi:hypothetical protein
MAETCRKIKNCMNIFNLYIELCWLKPVINVYTQYDSMLPGFHPFLILTWGGGELDLFPDVVYYTINTVIDTDMPLFICTTCFSLKGHHKVQELLQSPLFFPNAKPPYTGQCLHIGSVLDGCIVFAMPLYYINTVKSLSIASRSVIQFLWSLSESYFNYGSRIYCFHRSIVSSSDPRWKRWIEVSLYVKYDMG